MENLTDLIKFLHILSFVFMSVPLFNLIVVNERALMGTDFVYLQTATWKISYAVEQHAATCSNPVYW